MNELKQAYNSQKATSKIRGIEFLLTFDEWYKFWLDSGHLHERGKGKDKYCMARFGDKGAYKLGNIKIILYGENVREAVAGVSCSLLHRERVSISKRGTANGSAKLTPEKVLYIRRVYIPKHPEFGQSALGRKFGIGQNSIRDVILRINWAHI